MKSQFCPSKISNYMVLLLQANYYDNGYSSIDMKQLGADDYLSLQETMVRKTVWC